MGIIALLLVALTFYSTLTLGNGINGNSETRPGAIAALAVLVVPFGAFLWWLALGRLMAHKVCVCVSCCRWPLDG